ncbi:hypothetical protein HRTV-28_gp45 [Halorubrum tailed virus 28]|uniref:Uncharacterized protein n=1 Tax=Halorubrum tailed virus 28 TaxID=2878009 RepID=A0AAE9BYS9_9CAUD|nr:hypothetical protein M1M39_gp46 [Halorubrum tailed virus 28]UBF23483.1 hypothetical protein HRTV-28_gp45 [Halorubrum tailed virus 28]
MSAIELQLYQLAAIVAGAVVLAATDAAALSRLGLAWLSKKMGVKPDDIRKTDAAVDGDGGQND